MRIVLASSSPRRAALLTAAGFAFDVVRAEIDETMRPGERADEYVARLAEAKAAAVSGGQLGGMPILAADTTVVVDGRTLGKPRDAEDAAEMLGVLSGQTHEVLTGLAVHYGSGRRNVVEATRVEFTTLSPEEIRWYVGTGEPLDKAGAYAVQGLGARFVLRIEGSYTNVVGLPIERVYRLFKELGIAGLPG